VPETFGWDTRVGSLLGVQTGKAEKTDGGDDDDDDDAGEDKKLKTLEDHRDDDDEGGFDLSRDADNPGVVVYTLFATSTAIAPQETHPLPPGYEALLGLRAPSLYVCKKNRDENVAEASSSSSPSPSRSGGGAKTDGVCFSITMRDFAGVESASSETIDALIAFAMKLAMKDHDGAYKAVKTMTGAAAWRAAARGCIRNKRLEAAEFCLGNMGHLRGARAARDARKEPELDARVAAVAVHLGLVEEAERLYERCGRHDLLNELLQASGRWDEALRVASARDRIHLKTTHYNRAKHLETTGDARGAIEGYERAGRAADEVMRLFFQRGDVDGAEAYVTSRSGHDAKLTRWWGKYCESVGETERAMVAYEHAKDYLSLTRMYAAAGEWDAAEKIVKDADDAAAAFHLARSFEARDATSEALEFFELSGRYGHAARLARLRGMDGELFALALKSRQRRTMLDAAAYFLESGDVSKAATLFHAAGSRERAIELCFASGLHDQLAGFIDDVLAAGKTSPGEDGTSTDAGGGVVDAALLARCAEYFAANGRASEVRSLSHWSPYDRVGVVNADP
jgi:intraflagellar transport protein 140